MRRLDQRIRHLAMAGHQQLEAAADPQHRAPSIVSPERAEPFGLRNWPLGGQPPAGARQLPGSGNCPDQPSHKPQATSIGRGPAAWPGVEGEGR